jgi:hypothetical protein
VIAGNTHKKPPASVIVGFYNINLLILGTGERFKGFVVAFLAVVLATQIKKLGNNPLNIFLS